MRLETCPVFEDESELTKFVDFYTVKKLDTSDQQVI